MNEARLRPEEEADLELVLRTNPEQVPPAGVRLLQRAVLLLRWPAGPEGGNPLEALALRDPTMVMRTSLPAILEVVTGHLGVTLEELRSRSRVRRLSSARHMAAWLARRLTPEPLTVIAHQVGRRDHTTVIHGLHAMDARLLRDAELRATMQELLAKLTRPIPRAALEGGTAATATAVRMQDGARGA